jgi:hypothetical protein
MTRSLSQLSFALLALALLLIWNHDGRYAPDGDEPHYLVVARSIGAGSLEVSDAYRREFAQHRFYRAGLAKPDAALVYDNSHSVEGPNGHFSVHNIGLPALLAPFAGLPGGALICRGVMLLISLALPALAWRAGDLFIDRPGHRLLVAATLALSAPFLYAAGQIYPDFPAGVIFGWAALSVVAGRRSNWRVTLLLAFTPWLQIKFAAPMMVCFVALPLLGSAPRGLRSLTLWAAPFILSLAALLAFNRYAYGDLAGPYRLMDAGPPMQFTADAVGVLLGLHFDQFQGLMLRAPIFLFALLGLAAWLRSDWRKPFFLALLYGSLTLPNALHFDKFGGYSFAGRFGLAGAVVLVIPAAYGLALAMRLKPRLTAGLCVGHLALQALAWVRYAVGVPTLYNVGLPAASYPSFYAPWRHYFPYFYNAQFALSHWPNLAWLGAALCFVVAGWLLVGRGEKAAWRVLAGAPILILTSMAMVGAGLWPRLSHRYDAAALPSQTGSRDRLALTAHAGFDQPGYLSYGPYAPMSRGLYRFRLVYRSPAPPETEVGGWDVLLQTGGKAPDLELRDAGALHGTKGKQAEVRGTFRIHSVSDQYVQIRSFFSGTADLTIESLELAEE